MVERLGVSYNNSRSLHQVIDTLPSLAPWIKRNIVLDPENASNSDIFELYYRDPVEALKALWGNPAFLQHMSFEPERRYTDASRTTRRYNEMNSGD